ncbi:MAG: competence/damage-inducible protein A [Thermodesulfobacteriota bacterium]|nr:competence/damage-inducible protein A [Thermodesulfobacteriota bacterium]
MKVEIITVGNELTSGEVVNTNAVFMASSLTERGFEVICIATVGDNEYCIEDALLRSQEHADAIIVSGGLGPTADDVTANSAAKALGRRMTINKEILQSLRESFARRGMEMPLANEKQAFFPHQAEIIPNPLGTASGFILRHKGRIYVFLPGVPRELKHLFSENVLPLLEKERQDKPCFWSRTLKVFGFTESAIADRLKGINLQSHSAALAYLPRFPENHVKITIRGESPEEVAKYLEEMEKTIREKLEGRVFASDTETLEEIVGRMLRSNRATLAVAESCTGGLIAHRLTQIPGSSDYFERGLVAYSNRAKVEILKVPEELLAAHGAVSALVAEKMAEGVRQISQSTLGLGVTGIAGPGGGSEEKPVGTVFIALASPQGILSKRYQFQGDREQIKTISAHTAIDWVRRYFLNLLSGISGQPA